VPFDSFTMWWDHHFPLVSKYFDHPRKTLHTHKYSLPLLLYPGNHWFAFCLNGFPYSRYST
jgi:hypothetical protein